MPKPSNTDSYRRRYTPFRRKPERVPGVGPALARLMLIGEKPGLDEATHRPPTPFVGASGQILNAYLYAAGIDRKEVFVTNCVKEFTDYTKPTKEELERDKPELISEIMAVEPEIIGLVGAYAVTHVLSWDKADMDRRHGVAIRVPALFGGELTREGGWIVAPVYHPANVIHSSEMAPAVLDDYLQLGRLLDNEIEPIDDEVGVETDYRVVSVEELNNILSRF